MNFSNNFGQEAVGASGGIWCLWNADVWKVNILAHSHHCVHMRVACKFETPWCLSIVYGSPSFVEGNNYERSLGKLQRI